MSLESILNKSPRRKGRPRDDEAQPSTRGISAYDRKTLPANEFVHGVYYQENLLDQLLLRAKEKTQKVKIREEDWDLSAAMDVRILEKTTCTCLPRVLNSEKDVQTILQSKLLAPALLGIAVERAVKSADGYLNRSSLGEPPFISSGPCFTHFPIPDAVLIDSPVPSKGELKKQWWLERTKCVLEYKTPGVMSKVVVACKYNKGSSASQDKKDRTAIFEKAAVQINSQMHAFKTEYGILSSYNHTIFCYRKKVKGLGVLIYSKAYEYNEITPLHIFAWFLQCLEKSEDFKSESVDIEHVQPTLDSNDKKEEKNPKPKVNLVNIFELDPEDTLSSSDDKTVKDFSSSDCSIPSSDERVATSREKIVTRSQGKTKTQDREKTKTRDQPKTKTRNQRKARTQSHHSDDEEDNLTSNVDSINDPPPASITPSELGSGDEGDIALNSKGKGVEMGDMESFQRSRSTRITRRTTRGFSHDVSKLASSSAEGSTSRLKTTQEREKTTLDSMGPGRSKTYCKKDVSQHAKSEKVVGKQKESQRRNKKSYGEDDSGEETEDEEEDLGVKNRLYLRRKGTKR